MSFTEVAHATDVPRRRGLRLLLAGGGRRGRGLLEAVGAAELLAETLDAAGGVHEFLLAREERVSVAADIDGQPRLRAAGRKRVATGAVNGAGLITRMNLGLHNRLLAWSCVARQKRRFATSARRQKSHTAMRAKGLYPTYTIAKAGNGTRVLALEQATPGTGVSGGSLKGCASERSAVCPLGQGNRTLSRAKASSCRMPGTGGV